MCSQLTLDAPEHLNVMIARVAHAKLPDEFQAHRDANKDVAQS